MARLGQPSLGAQGPWKGQPPCLVSCQATGPFLHIGAVAGLTMLAWPVAACFYHISHAGTEGGGLFLMKAWLGGAALGRRFQGELGHPNSDTQVQLPPELLK